MKKTTLGLIAASTLLMAGCANDEPLVNGSGYHDGYLEFSVEMPGGFTRDVADGLSAKELTYAVFDEGGTFLFQDTPADIEFNNHVARVKIPLVNDKKYKVAFVAKSKNAPYAINEGVMTITYDANTPANNDDYDAFYKMKEIEVTAGMPTQTVELKRPFAQVNVGSTDWALAKKAGFKVAKTGYSFTAAAANTLNLVDGTVDNVQEVTFKLATPPDATVDDITKEITLPATLTVDSKDYEYMAMAYVLVPADPTTVNTVTFTYEGPKGKVDVPVTSVPVQRNHRTNIVGRFFTSGIDYEIVVDENFDGDLKPIEPDVVINAGASAQSDLNTVLEGVKEGDEIIIGLPAGEFTLPSLSGDVTFLGQAPVNGEYPTVVTMKNEVKTAQHVSFMNIKMERGTLPYQGFQHTAEESYTDCEITGLLVTYAGNVEFKNCKFTSPTDGYAVQVYGAPATAKFDNCEFHTDRKAVLVYNENNNKLDIIVNNCKFYRDLPTSKAIDKCAISCHTEQGTQGTLTINKSTATGFAPFNGGLWRDVDNGTDTPTDNFLVTVDGVVIPFADKQ